MKSELDAIWQTPGVAFTMHLAGWLTKEMAISKGLGYYDKPGLMAYRGKKLNPLNKKAKKAKNGRNS